MNQGNAWVMVFNAAVEIPTSAPALVTLAENVWLVHEGRYFLWPFFVVAVTLNFAVVFPFTVLVYRLDFSRKIDLRVCENTLPMSTHSGLVSWRS